MSGSGSGIPHHFPSGSGSDEWPHSQCVGLAYRWTRVRAPVAAAGLAICRLRLHHSIRTAPGVLLMRVGGATNQLDLPPLTPLSVASGGRLQRGVRHLATSVYYCK